MCFVYRRRRPFLEWTKHEAHAFFLSHGTYLKPAADVMLRAGVDGFLLASIEDRDLEKRFGVNDPKHRFRILTELASLCSKRPPVNKDALSRHETLMRRKVGIHVDAKANSYGQSMKTLSHPILAKYVTDVPPSPTKLEILEGTASRLARMSDEQLRDFCAEVFVRATDDFDGYLDKAEFKKILKGADLGFTARDVRAIMDEIDQKTWENSDGLIDWHEFEPVMMRLMRTIGVKTRVRAAGHVKNSEPLKFTSVGNQSRTGNQSPNYPGTTRHVQPMTTRATQYTVARIFTDADVRGVGKLTKDQFVETLKSAKLGLVKSEIDALTKEAGVDADGMIDYEEFTPIATAVLNQKLEGEYQTARLYETGDELLKTVMTAFDAVSNGEGEF
jgi:Ca2+-binding EF-hand superfamily protein